jgi:hypothetical protein
MAETVFETVADPDETGIGKPRSQSSVTLRHSERHTRRQ